MQSHIQIHTDADRFNTALHVAGALALAGVSFFYSGQLASAMGFIFATQSICRGSSYPWDSGDAMATTGLARKAAEDSDIQQTADDIAERLALKPAPRVFVMKGALENQADTDMTARGDLMVTRLLAERCGAHEQQGAIAYRLADFKAGHVRWQKTIEKAGFMTCYALTANAVFKAIEHAAQLSVGEPVPSKTVVGAAIAAAGLSLLATAFLNRSYLRACSFRNDRVAAQLTSPAIMEMTLAQKRLRDISCWGQQGRHWHDRAGPFRAQPTTRRRCAALRELENV